jgi:hypothetical protein
VIILAGFGSPSQVRNPISRNRLVGVAATDIACFRTIDAYAQQASECRILFSCETAHHEFIRICGEQDENNVDKWTNIQYRYGSEEGTPELVFPKDPSGKSQLFFSHEESKGDYRVSIRFSTGPCTYRVFSGSQSGAGVEVSDTKHQMWRDSRPRTPPKITASITTLEILTQPTETC